MSDKKFGFISYSSNDKEFVERLAKELNENGLPIFFDKWEIKVGDSIIEKIDLALGKMTDLIIILSKASVKSNWVKKELSSALIKKLKNNSVKILPVLKEKCKIPNIISDLKYADFIDVYENGFVDLVNALNLERKDLPVIKLPEIKPLGFSENLPSLRYKPLRHTDFKTETKLQLLGNIVIDFAGIYTGRQTLFCGFCSGLIFLNKGEPRPLVCTNCGNAINWLGIVTRLIKVCPLCSKTYSVQQNFCPLHFPAVALVEKEVDLFEPN